MNRAEAKAYFSNLAQKENLSGAEIDTIIKSFDDEKLAKVILDAFVPRPEYSSALNTKQAEAEAAVKEQKRLLDWYEKEGKPAYETNKQGIDKLQKYIEMYGELENATDRRNAAAATGLTKEEVQKMLQDGLQEQAGRTVSLVKMATRLGIDHYKTFQETLDVDALEKIALEKGLPLEVAYKELVGPKLEERREAAFKKQLDDKYKEGLRDARTKGDIPGDTKSKEPNLLTDRVQIPDKTDPDKMSRAAFFDGWENYAENKTQ